MFTGLGIEAIWGVIPGLYATSKSNREELLERGSARRKFDEYELIWCTLVDDNP